MARNTDFLLLAGGRAVSQLGDQMQFLALPLLVVAITGSAAQAGLVLGAQTLVLLVFGIYAGALVDQWDRKRTMIWCDVGRAVLTAIVPVAYFGDFFAMPLLYIMAIGNGILASLFSSANGSALPNIVPRAQLPAAIGTMGAVSNTLRIAGASVAGILYSAGRVVPFGFNAVTFLASAVSLRFIRSRFQESETQKQGAKPPQGDLRGHPGRTPPPPRWASCSPGAAAGALLGNVLAPRMVGRFPLGRLCISTLWIQALAFPFYAIAPTWWMLLFVAFAESVISPVYNVALDTYRLGQTPDAMRGRVTSSIETLVGGAAAIGTAVGGIAIDAFGPVRLTFVLTGWLVLLSVIASASRTLRHASVIATTEAEESAGSRS